MPAGRARISGPIAATRSGDVLVPTPPPRRSGGFRVPRTRSPRTEPGGRNDPARLGFRAGFLAVLLMLAGATAARADLAPLRVSGRHFVDPQGRVVILRGVNLTGNAKVPPFRHGVRPVDLDRLQALGFNLIRLVFIWEAHEPLPGVYDDAYLAEIRGIAAAAAERGIYTIIDVHQDGFSRFASRGAGDGFPRWALSDRGRPRTPDNGPHAKYWPALMATDPLTHKSFADFYADARGVRGRYLRMLGRIAPALAATPGVLGYDLMNEPWGDEARDLAPLYRDAAAAIRAGHPWAILFLEGQVGTNWGRQTRLPRPDFGGLVYAPHYYRPLTVLLNRWYGDPTGMDRAFGHMTAKAAEWDAPLFLGEFGVGAGADHAADYVGAIYDRLDAALASGAQWNYTPCWNPRDRDGWNDEDFNILDPHTGASRGNFRPRPYPRRTAGMPLGFRYEEGRHLDFLWEHRPEAGETEIALPDGLFPPGTTVRLDAADAQSWYDGARRAIVVRCPRPATLRLVVCAPVPATGTTAR